MNSTTSAESPAALRTCRGIPEHQVGAWDRRGALAYERFEPAARESSFDTGQFPRLWLPARFDFYAQPFSSRVHFIAGRRESEKVQQAEGRCPAFAHWAVCPTGRKPRLRRGRQMSGSRFGYLLFAIGPSAFRFSDFPLFRFSLGFPAKFLLQLG